MLSSSDKSIDEILDNESLDLVEHLLSIFAPIGVLALTYFIVLIYHLPIK